MAKRKKNQPKGVVVTFTYWIPLEEFDPDVQANEQELEEMAVELARLGPADVEVEVLR